MGNNALDSYSPYLKFSSFSLITASQFTLNH